MTTNTAEAHWRDMWADLDQEEDEPDLPTRFRSLAKKDTFEPILHGEGKWWE